MRTGFAVPCPLVKGGLGHQHLVAKNSCQSVFVGIDLTLVGSIRQPVVLRVQHLAVLAAPPQGWPEALWLIEVSWWLHALPSENRKQVRSLPGVDRPAFVCVRFLEKDPFRVPSQMGCAGPD